MNRKHPANRIWFCIALSTALWLPVGHAQVTRIWNNYQVYQPEITSGILVDTDNNQLKLRYNHCASTVFYQDRWFTVWNANTIEAEGDLGQLIYLSTSTDFTHWTVPEPVFSTGATSVNPIGPADHGRMRQWQPNLLVTDGELWCSWGENGKKPELVGTYCSKLTSVADRWENMKVLLPGDSGPPVIHPEIDGIVWRAFPSQNPVELSDGRIVAPVTMREKKGSFPAAQKRNAVIYTDDRGANWRLSELIQLPAAPTGQWEPTVYELDSGEIAMIARRNDKTNLVSPAEILLFATSSDKGATWSEYEVLPLEVLSSRMHVLHTGNRFCMIYNDHRLGDAGRKVDRYNLALFTSLSGRAQDWMPGVSVTHNLWGVAYPQMFEKDDALYAAFSQGSSRSIYTAQIFPKPDPARHCIFPRHLMNSRPDVRNGMLAFDFRQLVKSTWTMELDRGDFSIAARLVPRHYGMVVDGRANRKGMVLSLKKDGEGLALSCSIAGFPGGSRNFTMSETVPKGRPLYAGVSFQNGKRLRLYVNHAVEAFEISDRINLSTGAPLFFGSLQHTNSALFNYYGLIDQLLVFNRALDDDEHALLQSGGSNANGLQLRLNSDTFSGPGFTMAPAEIFEDTAYGTDIKRIRGQGSAAVEVQPFNLAAGDTVHIRFEYKTDTPKTAIVLCTIGDATNPLRVELAADGTIVARDNTGNVHSVAAHQPQVYTPVELAVSKTHAVISVNGTEARFNRSFNPARFFLGQGYLEKRDPSAQTFLCRISSVETRVQRP